ncbi:MAG: alpha/beta hydrolase [Alphaproteobacteria bacterium]
MYNDIWFRTQDGLRLYCRDYPSGDRRDRPVLLCLPGIARTSKDFALFAERRQADGWRLLCPDYRGRGRSQYDPDPSNYIPTRYLDDLRHLLAATGIHRVVVAGTSLGGLLGLGLAAATPMALAGLIMNDIGPTVETGGLDRIIGYIGNDRTFGTIDDVVTDVKAFLNMPNLTEEEWRIVADGSVTSDGAGGYRLDWDTAIAEPLKRQSALPDIWGLFKAVRSIPVLALRGEVSDILSRETFGKMQDGMPFLTGVEVPDAGHCPTLQEPIANEAVDDFLSRFR